MSDFVTYFELFGAAYTVPVTPDPALMPTPMPEMEAWEPATMAYFSELFLTDDTWSQEMPVQDPAMLEGGDPGWGYRNDTVGVGMVMDPNASTWQDSVWIDWD